MVVPWTFRVGAAGIVQTADCRNDIVPCSSTTALKGYAAQMVRVARSRVAPVTVYAGLIRKRTEHGLLSLVFVPACMFAEVCARLAVLPICTSWREGQEA
jgi:hypothetical protein